MMFFHIPAVLVLLFLTFGASAAPGVEPLQVAVQQESKREVWVPPPINPKKGTVWHIGEKVSVTWDTSTRPAQVTNPSGTIVLGFLKPDGEGGENLDLDHPLAKNFPLSAGKVEFVVPRVKPGHNYIVVVLGDSGNATPEFTIES